MADLDKFTALVARDGVAKVEETDASLLHDGDGVVTVRVAYSCINYKDALGITNKGKILLKSPIIPGIDYAGEVVEGGGEFKPGDKVVLTGHAVGEKYSGGYAAYARANPDWLLPLPAGLDEKQAMICGTAGLTAALCVLAVHESGYVKSGNDIVVSGASGGVGSFAVALLSRLGYQVSAVSREAAQEYLQTLGAKTLLSREEMAAPARPLEKARWHGAVDCVGGTMLARILAETGYGGVVAACGLAGGHKLETTVMPFILRGVRLDGVDSVAAPRALRERAWKLLAETLQAVDYETIHSETVTLPQTPEACEQVLKGDFNGRLLVTPTA